jgi:hypothetical protein
VSRKWSLLGQSETFCATVMVDNTLKALFIHTFSMSKVRLHATSWRLKIDKDNLCGDIRKSLRVCD